MNTRKLKLDLTIGLINKGNAFSAIKELMQTLKTEVGNFLGVSIIRDSKMTEQLMNQIYAIRYENCTLNVDVVWNKSNNLQYVKGFNIN